MINLTHDEARELIQQPFLGDSDRLALRQHLARCNDCALYAAFHLRLSRELTQQPARVQPTAAQRAAILAAAMPAASLPRIPSPLMSLASMAIVALLLVASWALFARVQPVQIQEVTPSVTLRAERDVEPSPASHVLLTDPIRAETDPRGQVNLDSVPAPSLAGNLIGEPLEQRALIYLPPSYASGDKRYPVVYALHYDAEIPSANLSTWLASTTRGAANVALQKRLARETIIVVPDSKNVLDLPNYFVNSAVIGDWQSYLAKDLVDYVDAHYRTLPRAESRGVFGEGNVGWAALQLAATHRDRFSAVYLSQPLFLAPGALEHMNTMSTLVRPSVAELMARANAWPLDEGPARLGGEMRTLSALSLYTVVSYGISLVPDPSGPPYFDYPYGEGSDEPDPAIWRRWEGGLGDVPQKIEQLGSGLGGLTLAISRHAGRRQPFDQPDIGPAYLSEQLDAAGINHLNLDLPENQPMISELAEEALPFFSENLSFVPVP